MTDLLNLISQEEIHRVYVEHRFRDLVELFERSYSLFLISADEAREKHNAGKNQDYHRIYLLMINKINSDMRAIFHCIRYGWYSTAHTLIREINDALVKIIFISNFPNRIKQIEEHKLKTKEIKKILLSEGFKLPISEKAWGVLSQMKHADGEPIIGYCDFNENLDILRFYSTINNPNIQSLLVFNTACFVRICEFFGHFYENKYGITYKYPLYKKELEKLGSIIDGFIEEENKKYGIKNKNKKQ